MWLGYAGGLEGGVTKTNIADLYAQLYGGLTALLSSMFICFIGMAVKPMSFDWSLLQDEVKLVVGDGGENAKVLGNKGDGGSDEELLEAKKWVFKYGWGYSIFLVVLWPLACVPMGSFGKSTFQLWAGIALMWGWLGAIVIIGLPLYESFGGLKSMFTKKAPLPVTEKKGGDTTPTETDPSRDASLTAGDAYVAPAP